MLSETNDQMTIANNMMAQLAVFEAFKVGAIADMKYAKVCIDKVKGYIRKKIIMQNGVSVKNPKPNTKPAKYVDNEAIMAYTFETRTQENQYEK